MQTQLPQFFNRKRGEPERKIAEKELLELQERLGVYAWILFGE